MKVLGHRSVINTMVYIDLAQALCPKDDAYVCKVATTVDEASKLVEAGFEHVCEIDG
jgi:hypothetical protein